MTNVMIIWMNFDCKLLSSPSISLNYVFLKYMNLHFYDVPALQTDTHRQAVATLKM